MNKENTFSYTYSAKENQEVLQIRQKYLPREETKLDELKRLDRLVQSSGITEGLSIGVFGCLMFGFGLCLTMKVIGSMPWLGIALGLLGTVVMVLAYPVYKNILSSRRKQYTPQILELSEKIMNNQQTAEAVASAIPVFKKGAEPNERN